MFSLFRIYEASPHSFGGLEGIPVFRNIIKEMGFDPDNRSMDLTTPIGIGNRAGLDTARMMAVDGWNAQGDLTATQRNYIQPFSDYTGYTPKNSPWNIKFPFKWQPLLENNGRGFFFRQESVVPFAGSAIAFSMSREEVNRRTTKSPFARRSANVANALSKDIRTLKKLARGVLRVSANLTEEQRLFAEFFDNKGKSFRTAENPEAQPSIATALRFLIVAPALDLNLDEEMIYGMGTQIATFDSMVMAWKEKRRLDSARPTGQLMKFLFGDKKVKVWGGPGKGSVLIKPEEWHPYIRTMPHGEFPSGSACTCSVLVEHALINTNGTDEFPFEVTVPKGSSKFFPGLVPEKDVTLRLERLSDWGRLCGESRVWAGVHFAPSVTAGEKLCRGIGRSAQDFVDKLAAGELDAKWMEWLPKDVGRFWEED